MPQHALDWRRLGLKPGDYETMERRSAGRHIDADMMARHEYLSARRGNGVGGQGDVTGRQRRERELQLLKLAAQ